MTRLLVLLAVLLTPALAVAEVKLPPIGTVFSFRDRVLGCDTAEQVRQVIAAKVANDPSLMAHLFVSKDGAEPACVLGTFNNVVVEADTGWVGALVDGVMWEVHILRARASTGYQFFVLLPFKQDQQGGA